LRAVRRAGELAWRREYNEERPERVLGGLTPAEYALRLTDQKVITMPGKL